MAISRSHQTPRWLRASIIGLTIVGSLAYPIAVRAKSSNSRQSLPIVVSVTPTSLTVGSDLTITGRNFVTGKHKMLVLFGRPGVPGHVTVHATAKNSTTLILTIPDSLTNHLPTSADGLPTSAVFRIRLVNKYGVGKKWSSVGASPTIAPRSSNSPTPGCDKTSAAAQPGGDFDKDGLNNALELQIGTDPCSADSDSDGVPDGYEYQMATAINGSPVLPYNSVSPSPNPLVADSGVDHDGDGLSMLHEYEATQFTHGRVIYSDANQFSVDGTATDAYQDVDGDGIPNIFELTAFSTNVPPQMTGLNWLNTDSDGDGLCDGLDDQDHDGPAVPVGNSVCQFKSSASTRLTSEVAASVDPTKTYLEDNIYSNWYEWYHGTGPFNPCTPSVYPVSQFCPAP